MLSNTLNDRLTDTLAYLNEHVSRPPAVGIILGSGLGHLADQVTNKTELPYASIPHFPISTVEGHAGKLIFGELAGKAVVMMAGRFHYYEGYSMDQVTFPIRVMKALGIGHLLLSNAAGGLDSGYKVGDIVLIRDHINLFPEHPLRGPNDSRIGPRFPDMSEPYDLRLLARAQDIARQKGIRVHQGVYAGLQGPSFETHAEYRWLRTIGADVVGMSTIPETIVAVHGGLKVFAASIVSNLGIREGNDIVSHEEVLQATHDAAPRLASIFSALVRECD